MFYTLVFDFYLIILWK